MSFMFPFELVEEILSRVPVKDLIRFRCVCKSWLLLFQDERFIRKHMSHAPGRFMSFHWSKLPLRHSFYETEPKTETSIFEEVDLITGDKSLLQNSRVIIGHCHGLFCLDLGDDTFGIWNPSLRELRRIPTRHILNWAEIGFGYDHSTQDYKIVLVPDMEWGYSKAQVLSLKSGVSRMIDFPYPTNFVMWHLKSPGTLLGENIYWVVYDDVVVDVAETILSFDLVSETFNYFPGPPTRGQPFPLVLDVLRGSLCTVGMERVILAPEIVVWSAQHQGANNVAIKSWSKIFTLSWGLVQSLISPGVDHCQLASALTYAGLLLFAVFFKGEIKLFEYNLEENSLRAVETNLSLDSLKLVKTYIETLVPIPGATAP